MNTFVQVLVKHGYSALFASVFACQMGLPIPAILFLMAAGVLACSGQLSLGVALGLAIIACLLADLLWYEAGRRWGNQILLFFYGLASDPQAAVRRSQRNFDRHGPRTLMIAKFVVGLDAAAPPLAGLSGTSRLRFLAFDAVGAALWAGAYAGLGYVFSKDLDRAASYVASLGKVFAVLLVAGVTIYFGRKVVRRVRAVRDFRRARIAQEKPKGRLETGERIMTLDFQNQKEAHGIEHAPGQSHHDACGQYTIHDCSPMSSASYKMALLARIKASSTYESHESGCDQRASSFGFQEQAFVHTCAANGPALDLSVVGHQWLTRA